MAVRDQRREENIMENDYSCMSQHAAVELLKKHDEHAARLRQLREKLLAFAGKERELTNLEFRIEAAGLLAETEGEISAIVGDGTK